MQPDSAKIIPRMNLLASSVISYTVRYNQMRTTFPQAKYSISINIAIQKEASVNG